MIVNELIKGEDGVFLINGGDRVNLDTTNFKVLIYLNLDFNDVFVIEKSSAVKVGTNKYRVIFPKEETISRKSGLYAFEIRWTDDNGTVARIVQRSQLFMLKEGGVE